MMSGIKGKNTKPELLIRRGLHALGFRYRLHVKDLPGKPDIVLPRWHAVIFVHGCFWHGHDCHLFKWPKTRTEFWRKKIEANSRNDERAMAALQDRGWRALVVWECALKGRTRMRNNQVVEEAARWLKSGDTSQEIVGNRQTPSSS